MVSMLGSTPRLGYFIAFLGNTLFSDGVSLHPGVQISLGKFNAGVTVEWTS